MMEISAGAIIYTIKDNKIYYLLQKDFHGNYGFAKGHLEEGETELMAAKREIKEEVGLDVKIDKDFCEVTEYVMPNGIEKRVYYYLAYYENQEPVLQEEEVEEVVLLPYEEALNTLTFDNMKEFLTKADNYLNNQSKKQVNKDLLQTIKFTLFSISAGVIQIISFTLFNEILKLGWWPSYLISLILSVLWNFTLNRNYTFKSASNVPVAMAKVFAYYCVFTPLSTIFGNYLTGTLGWNDYVVTGIDMFLNLVTEFLYQKYYVFRDTLNKD
ncbi:MAG: NUDIX domain-containing protein [Erysipelotrichaceae bacterium]|nr:NUDIX domain-containing protein [Erysipelotrichaceae bacterium]